MASCSTIGFRGSNFHLGVSHRAKNFVGVIGRRMADSGFDEILEESGLYNQNQINGILSGKHYTRSIVAH